LENFLSVHYSRYIARDMHYVCFAVICAHIMTLLPLPEQREEEKRSPIYTYSAILFLQQKTRLVAEPNSSPVSNVQPLNLLYHRTLSCLCNGVNTAPKYDLLGLMPCCRSRLRTVCELILRNPGIPAAVVDAATVRFRR
jgi:hypothetical protein